MIFNKEKIYKTNLRFYFLFLYLEIRFVSSCINAGKSPGYLDITKLPSTTTSLSSQIPPAFFISSGTPSCQ